MHVCVSCLQVFCLLLKGSLCIITVVNKKLSCRRDSTHRRSLHFISRSFKVTSFGTCHKPMVLLVNTTNLHPVTHRLQVFVDNWLQWIINCCEYYRRRDANVVMNVSTSNIELYLPPPSCLVIRSWAWYTKWCIYHSCCHLYSRITLLFPLWFIPIMLDIRSFLFCKPTHSLASDR